MPVTVAAAVILLALYLAAMSVRFVRAGEAGVVVQLGEFAGVHGPGLVLLVPVIQRLRRVDVREVSSERSCEAATSDGVRVVVDLVAWHRVVDPHRALFAVSNYVVGIDVLLCSSIRALVEAATFDECSRWDGDHVRGPLAARTEAVTTRWGVEVTLLELAVR